MADRMSRKGGEREGTVRAIARWVSSRMGGRTAQPGVVRAPEPLEETGVWGVGGPAMRQPGSTGIVRALKVPGEDSED
ncbi:MAG: hypothetical protein IT480_00275 [Gammaproteobacteria bacterium]|nr:hypothetical protein [Gammaproteobacteria bacterium]